MSIFERLRRRRQEPEVETPEAGPVTSRAMEASGSAMEARAEQESGEAEHQAQLESLAEVPFAGDAKTAQEELDAREREMIAGLPNAVEENGIDAVNRRIGFKGVDAKHERRVLAFMTGKGFDNYMAADKEAIEKFLEKYPTPVEFDEPSRNFLKMIENANSEEKLHEYEDAMHNFKLHIYGKQYRKWQELQNAEEIDEFAEEKTEKWAETRETPKTSRIEVEGDMWIEDRRGYKLTPEILARNGLAPKYSFENAGQEMQLSESWKVGEREAIAAYIKDGYGNVKVENYYRSGPKKFWRKLVEYVKDESEYPGENSKETVLPEEMQKGLSAIVRFGERAEPSDNPRFLLEGAAKRYDSAEEYLVAKRQNS